MAEGCRPNYRSVSVGRLGAGARSFPRQNWVEFSFTISPRLVDQKTDRPSFKMRRDQMAIRCEGTAHTCMIDRLAAGSTLAA